MKKLLFILTLICAFSINASAQESKLSSQDLARKDAAELTELVGLKDGETENFFRLFETKYTILEDKNLSQERKTILSNTIEAKIRASLNEKQIAVLEANPELFKRIK
jgi:hypothetical protein